MSTPNTNLQTCWQQWNFTRDEWNNLLHLFNITHFRLFCCSQNFSFFCCTKTMVKKCKNRKEETGNVKVDDDERGLHCLDKFFDCAESGCVEKAGDTRCTRSNRWVQYRETWRKKKTIETQRRVLKDGRKMQFWMLVRGNSSRQKKTKNTWIFLKIQQVRGTRRFRKLRNRRQWHNLPHKSHTKIGSRSNGWNEEPRCEHSSLGYVSVCHSSSSSSSWWRLHREFAIYQEWKQEIFETDISSDSEVRHRPDRNSWTYNDWLTAA